MFHIENGIKLTRSGLALDFRRRQARAFVSHAHFDHMARHELALCTPATARLYQHRLGRRRVVELAYRRPVEFGGLTLTAFPAGHCLGSAMLLADDGSQRLLYTGDFKLGPSATAEPAELPRADVLIMESTFGRPQFRLPPREEAIRGLVGLVGDLLADGATPVLHLYPLGKAQEVTRILTDHGIRVQQHPEIFAISRVYEACGVALGKYVEYPGGHRLRRAMPVRTGALEAALCGRTAYRSPAAVITLPKSCPRFRLTGLVQPVSIGVTGWAAGGGAARRFDVDHVIALSDHADYGELLEAVRRVDPAKVYCTHGPSEFVNHLRAAGWDAERLEWSSVRALA